MPLIQKRPANQRAVVSYKAQLTQEDLETLKSYTAFLEEKDPDYVLAQLIARLRTDADFVAFLKRKTGPAPAESRQAAAV